MQEKELSLFRAGLKQEQKLLKQEVEQLAKDQRKNAWRIRKEQLDRDQNERVSDSVRTFTLIN
jgi:STE20-like kinase